MVERLVVFLIFRETVGQSAQVFLTQQQVVQLVFEDDTGVEQSVFDDIVALGHLVFGEGYLLHVILAFVWVVLGVFQRVFHRVFLCFQGSDRVALFVGQFHLTVVHGHHCLVDTLPVIYVFALAPLFLECFLALADGHGIIEIPQALLGGGVVLGVVRLVLCVGVAALCRLLLFGIGLCLCVTFSFLLLFQCLNHAVDGSIALGLGHLGQCLQRVLQVYGFGVRHQFVEHLGTL